MERVLILTGWSVDYACAAAAAMARLPEAEIVPLSKRRLGNFLNGLCRKKKDELPDTLLILGISLAGNLELYARKFAKLKRAGVSCIYFTRLQPFPEMIELLGKRVDIIGTDQGSLTQLVAKHFKTRKSKYYGLIRLVELSAVHRTPADQQLIDLIDAANWQHRVNDDNRPYQQAIRTLSTTRTLNKGQQILVRTYERFKNLEMRGDSPAVRDLWDMIKATGADGDCSVLIGGETGTGKEVVASLIHLNSPRADAPFEALNCATLSPQLLRSELFGHRKGAFTGADRDYRGAFERADGGTLFLDEIGDMPSDLQAALLRALQERRFVPLGSEDEVQVDVRVLAATNRNLWEMVEKNEFRMDLLFRLNVIEIHIPPLRERTEDISAIAEGYLRSQGRALLTEEQVEQLSGYEWPGNVRQLLNILDRARILGEDDYGLLVAEQPSRSLPSDSQIELVSEVLTAHSRRIFRKYGSNKTHAAKALGISINTLIKYLNGAK